MTFANIFVILMKTRSNHTSLFACFKILSEKNFILKLIFSKILYEPKKIPYIFIITFFKLSQNYLMKYEKITNSYLIKLLYSTNSNQFKISKQLIYKSRFCFFLIRIPNLLKLRMLLGFFSNEIKLKNNKRSDI